MAEPGWDTPIAIVGMACRLPGAGNLDEYWRLLSAGRCAIDELPGDVLDRRLYYAPHKGTRGKTYSTLGGMVDRATSVPELCRWTDELRASYDPCHRTLCEVAATACHDAGYDPLAAHQLVTGVYVGHSGGSTLPGQLAYSSLLDEVTVYLRDVSSFAALDENIQQQVLTQVNSHLRADRAQRAPDGSPHVEAGEAAALIARMFGFTGPRMSIDAACASSLVALLLAALAIRSGQIEQAIVAGASFNKSDSLILFSHAQSCSATGSRPFDAAADGLISAEGYVALVVKSLARAQADGDRIHGVVRGLGFSSDGRGRSLWAPRQEGQLAAIQRAYPAAVDPRRVQYLEAHATGTQVGDATEMEALGAFFAPLLAGTAKKIPIGSVKANIGHTLETAGLASLVKVLLAMRQQQIPPLANFAHPNGAMASETLPLRLSTTIEPWPEPADGLPRLAAVNAFGIGGLNMHVVVEDGRQAARRPTEASPTTNGHVRRSAPGPESAIAIVGRGVVLPGAFSVAAFRTLLQTGVDPKSAAPALRWREAVELNVNRRPITRLGGFIRNYTYDWRRHKIPPRQIAEANPLQFMLLDAVEQALREAGCQHGEFNRAATATVVGSIFGGDFSNQLQVGLRLPEFRDALQLALTQAGLDDAAFARIADDYERLILQLQPALLDETGSFTSSTLASRIAKTFDLNGGALAIDAGEASGLAALAVACDLLRSGQSNLAICAGAQRGMDRVAYECLALEKRLAGTTGGPANEGHVDGLVPGEGVAVVVLQRLSDARRDGKQILGVLHGIGAAASPNSLANAITASVARSHCWDSSPKLTARQLGQGVARMDQIEQTALQAAGVEIDRTQFAARQTASQIGFLRGTQGLVTLVESTFDTERCLPNDSTPAVNVITSYTTTGPSALAYCVPLVSAAAPAEIASAGGNGHVDATSRRSTIRPPAMLRFGGSDWSAIGAQLQHTLSDPAVGLRQTKEYRADDRARLTIVIDRSDNAIDKLKLALAGWERAAQRRSWPEHGIFAVERLAEPPQVAFLFPGQGSQYPGMLANLIKSSAAAARVVAVADRWFAEHQCASFAELTTAPHAHDAKSDSADSIWATQAAVLVADLAMHAALNERGIRADVLAAHSYGEFAALVAAGCCSLTDALQLTQARAACVERCAGARGGMLSLAAGATAVAELVRQAGFDVWITHHNGPRQTVVAGEREQVERFGEFVRAQGVGTAGLRVPAAFHTSLMRDAQPAFAAAVRNIRWQLPQTTVISSVTNRPIASAADIVSNLTAQLVEPVHYHELIESLVAQRPTLLIEVGPQQVLTRLNRTIVNDRHGCAIATDHPSRTPDEQWRHLQAMLECRGVSFDSTQQQSSLDAVPGAAHANGAPSHFDATAFRRSRMRQRAALPLPTVPSSMVVGASATHAQETSDLTSAIPTVEDTSHLRERLATFLIQFVVEQTGYPADVVELEADLEADLGIDSIKRAQMLGELREYFDFSRENAALLTGCRSLAQLIDLVIYLPGKSAWLPQAAGKSQRGEEPRSLSRENASPIARAATEFELRRAPPTAMVADRVVPAASRHVTERNEDLAERMVQFVIDETGFPRDVVTLDADLEADLGIDSIKKAQLLGELRDHFGQHVSPQSSAVLASIRTLREIHALIGASGGWPANANGTPPIVSQLPADVPRNVLAPPTSVVEGMVTLHGTPYEIGRQQAVKMKRGIDTALRKLAACATVECANVPPADSQLLLSDLSADELAELQSLAEATHYHPLNLLAWNQWYGSHGLQVSPREDADCQNIGATTRWVSLVHGDWCVKDMCELPLAPVVRRPLGGLAHVVISLPGQLGGLAGANSKGLMVAIACMNSAVIGNNSVAGGVRQRPLPLMLAQLLRAASTFEEALTLLERAKPHATGTLLLATTAGGSSIAVVSDGKTFRTQQRTPTFNHRHSSSPLSGQAAGNRWFEIDFDLAGQRIIYSCAAPRLMGHSHKVEIDLRQLLSQPAEVVQSPPTQQPEPSGTSDVTAAAAITPLTSRFVLQMQPSPRRRRDSRRPQWSGAALILGNNSVARELRRRLARQGVPSTLLPETSAEEAVAALDAAWQRHPSPHLFVVTARERAARGDGSWAHWRKRSDPGVMIPFAVCQRWASLVADAGLFDQASLVACTSLGGDFGLSGNVTSAESGAICGLVKAIAIELWVQGHRRTPIKVIDAPDRESAETMVDQMFRELAAPNYDVEIGYCRGVRSVVQAVREPLHDLPTAQIEPGSVWVCTGGARGITAFVARELARRFQLRLHLIGASPAPQLPDRWRQLTPSQLKQQRVEIMDLARAVGRNPIKEWQRFEKAIEIDQNLRAFKNLGIEATYHACDVSDRQALAQALAAVRAQDGPIAGVIHGAGVGKDARFDRKELADVRKCFQAKVDGAAALMELTAADPLRYFIAFGSISGRFGANGHTDYSAANDMLCKQIDAFRRRRPDCAAAAFHWHAWGDVGMATKPETQLALQMIGMQFMPAAEGIEHLVNELRAGLPVGEVLITDDQYQRKFHPVDAQDAAADARQGPVRLPFIANASPEEPRVVRHTIDLDPVRDPFLTDHRLHDRPILPIAVGLELLCESAAAAAGGGQIVALRDIKAHHAVRFPTDEVRTLQVVSTVTSNAEITAQLQADVRTRSGQLVEPERMFLSAHVQCSPLPTALPRRRGRGGRGKWETVQYLPRGGEFYLGPALRALRQIRIRGHEAVGKIIAPLPVELAGAQRDARGWLLPSAVLDACLYATGLLAWRAVAPGTALPSAFGKLTLGRWPKPGEECRVITRLKQVSADGANAAFDFTLCGRAGDILLEAVDYQVVWLPK